MYKRQPIGDDQPDVGLNVIREAKNININAALNPGQIGVDQNDWPFIQLYNFNPTGNVEVQYNKGGGAQTTTLTFDTVDSFAGIDLDRRTYPQSAQVHVTVTDTWLNIDPTDEDSWTWDTKTGAAYYQIFNEGGTAVGLNSTGGPAMSPVTSSDALTQEDAVFKLAVDQQNSGTPVIELQDNDDSDPTVDGLTNPVTLTERGPKSGVFGSYDESDVSILRITDDARRGTSAVVNLSLIHI